MLSVCSCVRVVCEVQCACCLYVPVYALPVRYCVRVVCEHILCEVLWSVRYCVHIVCEPTVCEYYVYSEHLHTNAH